jgi:hypothetical protein
MHRSRLCHFVIDVSDLDAGVAFWSAALGAAEEPVSGGKPPRLPAAPTPGRRRARAAAEDR